MVHSEEPLKVYGLEQECVCKREVEGGEAGRKGEDICALKKGQFMNGSRRSQYCSNPAQT